MLESHDLGDIENLSSCSNNFDQKAKSFKHYFKNQFGVDIVSVDEYGNIFCERDTYIPKGLTDQQIMDIRRTSGIKFYELSEFSGEPTFFGVWKKATYFKDSGFIGYGDEVHYFFDSYQEAIKESKKYLKSFLGRKTFAGTMSTLSETPMLLHSFVNNTSSVAYDEEKQCLTTNYLQEDEALALHELLKDKVFEIRTMSLAEVDAIDHMAYEIM